MSMGLITLARIARLLAVSESSVLRWSHAGTFPAPVILPDGRRRWQRSEVAAWMGGLKGDAGEDAEKEPPSLTESARDVLQALEEAGAWMSGTELGKASGRTGGSLRRAIPLLKSHGLIESDASKGYRLKPGAMVPTT